MAAPVTLAPVPAVSASAEARLAYVLQHFRLAYAEVPAVTIGQGPRPCQVSVADEAADFFKQGQPYPAAPTVREWDGRALPFFFGGDASRPLLESTPQGVFITADIISAAFYLLSGWQEYFSEVRDRHGRFPYAASVQARYGFVALPLVNYYFDVLRAAVEQATGTRLVPRRWNPAGAPLAAFTTHDVDSLRGGWGTAGRHWARQARLGPLLRLGAAWVLRRPAPWHNLAAVQAAVKSHGACSTFFVLGSGQPAPNGTPNADYTLAQSDIKPCFRQLAAGGAELATHGSYGTAEAATALAQEIARLKEIGPVQGNRFHYLCWEPRHTPDVVASTGLAYDSTLGFAEHYGFRHSYCHPFFPFDFTTGRAHTFLEIPLNVMDATLHHPQYLQLPPHAVLPALQPLFAEIEKFGGVATVLWHNENFDPLNTVNGPRQFDEIMRDLRARGACFLTGSEIVRHLCKE